MKEIYKIMIYGSITNDLNVTTTSTGKKYLRLNLTITNAGTKKDGTQYNHVEYFNCTAWDNLADEICASYSKGDRISVECTRTAAEYVNKNGVQVKDWNLNIKKVNDVQEDSTDKKATVSKPKPQPQSEPVQEEDDMPF